MPALVHQRPDGSTRTLEFAAAANGVAKPLIIGRLSASDITVRDTFVSRVHCGISFANGQFILKDLGSANGTYRNGARIYEAPLNPGDKIQIGNTTLVFELEAGTGNAILRQIPHMVAPPESVSGAVPPSAPGAQGVARVSPVRQ
jgi:pSer/pThr/pTyr-binding forkhead associated (FHA) protein